MKNIINEKRYLQNDLESISYFNECRKKAEEEIAKSLEENKEAIYLYEKYLDYVTEELLFYNFKNALEYSIALGYLIKKGYLSENIEFKFQESSKEISCKYGISILSGGGCCRNFSDIHEDICKRLSINIIPFYCYEGKNFLDTGLNKPANHIINIIPFDNNLYGIDLFNNLLLYGFKNAFIMKSISTNHDCLLRYKPYYDIILNKKSLSDLKERIKEFEQYTKIRTISSFQYESVIRSSVEEILFNNMNRLVRFNDKTHTLRKEIISKIKHK